MEEWTRGENVLWENTKLIKIGMFFLFLSIPFSYVFFAFHTIPNKFLICRFKHLFVLYRRSLRGNLGFQHRKFFQFNSNFLYVKCRENSCWLPLTFPACNNSTIINNNTSISWHKTTKLQAKSFPVSISFKLKVLQQKAKAL